MRAAPPPHSEKYRYFSERGPLGGPFALNPPFRRRFAPPGVSGMGTTFRMVVPQKRATVPTTFKSALKRALKSALKRAEERVNVRVKERVDARVEARVKERVKERVEAR